MAKIIEPYQPQKIEIIRRMLEKQAEKQQPMAYEIFVDNFKVVMKTTDLSEFDSYEDIMNNDTKFIRINIYNSLNESVSSTKYVFEVNDEKKTTTQRGLEGIPDIDTKIKESVGAERERWDKEQLVKELNRTKMELHDAEEYIDQLIEKLNLSKSKSNYFGKIDLGLLAGAALEGILRKNPQWLTKVPGLEGLAGTIAQENQTGTRQLTPAAEESEASFSKQSEPELSEEEKGHIQLGKQLAEHFNKEELALLQSIINKFSDDTSQLKTVAELLSIPV